MKKWVVQPWTSFVLWLMWQLLHNGFSVGHMALGLMIALALPLFTVRFLPEPLALAHPLKLLHYVLILLWDIMVANWVVAGLILGPRSRLQPALITFPVSLDNKAVAVLLAQSLSLTPGTVSADLSADGKILRIHALDVQDEEQLIAMIQKRYETPLKEIWNC